MITQRETLSLALIVYLVNIYKKTNNIGAITMKYDFTTRINRAGSGSVKWDAMYTINPNVDSTVVPLSVADMEFRMPPELTEG